MGTTTTIKTIFTADGTQLAKTITKTEKSVDKLSKGALSGLATTLGAAFAFKTLQQFALESVKMAGTFDTAMRNVNTIAKQSEDQFARTKNAVLMLAVELGKSPTELAEALYNINSAGFKGAEAMSLLELSTKAALGGVTSVAIAAKATTAVLNAYSLGVDSASDVSDILFATVEKGVITYEELAGGIGKVLPTAVAANVKFDQLAAAIAALTKQGMDSDAAMISMNGLILQLINPTEALASAWLKYTGVLPSTTLQTTDLATAIGILDKIDNDNIETTVKFISEKRSLRAALGLTGESAKLYADAIDEVATKTKRAGTANGAYEQSTKSIGHALNMATSSFDVFKIAFGGLVAMIYQGNIDDTTAKLEKYFNLYHKLAGDIRDQTFSEEELARLMASKNKRINDGNKLLEEQEDIQDKIKLIEDKQLVLANLKVDAIAAQRTAAEKLESKQKDLETIQKSIVDLYSRGPLSLNEQVDLTDKLIAEQNSQKDIAKFILDNQKELNKDKDAQLKLDKELNKEMASLDEKIESYRLAALDSSDRLEEINGKLQQLQTSQKNFNDKSIEYKRIQVDILDLEEEKDRLLKQQAESLEDANQEAQGLTGELEKAKNEADALKDAAGAIKNNLAGANLPFLSQKQLERWKEFLKAVTGKKVAANIDIKLPFISKTQLKRWKDLITAISGKNVKIEVEAPTANVIKDYEKLAKIINSIQPFSVPAPPAPNVNQNANITMTFAMPSNMSNGIPIDTTALQNIGIASIEQSLKVLSGLKGVIWA